MTRLTENNTYGFTANELREMNDALDRLAAMGHEDDENHISDFINNQYQPEKTSDEYVSAYLARLNA